MLNRQNDGKKALIIGCGVAGPAVALFLRKAGIETAIYESEQEADDYAGLFLNLARNGIRVLKELGLDDQIREEGYTMFKMIMRNGGGKVLGVISQYSGEPQGSTVKRGFLHKLLREEALRQGIPIEYGRKLKDIRIDGENKVTALFADGTSATGNLLIGCDGIHSRTRKVILPSATPPSFTGLISYGGFTRLNHLPYEPGIQNMVFGKKAFFGYLVKQSREVYWFGNMNYPGQPTRRELYTIPQTKWRETIRHLHRKDPAPIQEIVDSTEGEIGLFPIYDIQTQPVWHRGPVVLVGDAIHATSPSAGQGASLALEDAIVLAQCLRDIPNTEQAFAKYRELRVERVERVVKYSRMIGQHKNATNPVQVFFRDLLLPMFLRSANKDSHDWMYDYKIDWGTKVNLPV